MFACFRHRVGGCRFPVGRDLLVLHPRQPALLIGVGRWGLVARRPKIQLRCRGSRMSRKASPRRFVPNTPKLMASPGKITNQGAVRTYSAADSDSILPQEGCGSGIPRPKNESVASV